MQTRIFYKHKILKSNVDYSVKEKHFRVANQFRELLYLLVALLEFGVVVAWTIEHSWLILNDALTKGKVNLWDYRAVLAVA